MLFKSLAISSFNLTGSYDHSPTTAEPNCEWPEAQLPSGDVGDSELLQQSLADAMSEVPAKENRQHRTSVGGMAGKK